jgi:hypothetical protein
MATYYGSPRKPAHHFQGTSPRKKKMEWENGLSGSDVIRDNDRRSWGINLFCSSLYPGEEQRTQKKTSASKCFLSSTWVLDHNVLGLCKQERDALFGAIHFPRNKTTKYPGYI